MEQYSAEYMWKKWTFQAEYFIIQDGQNTTSPFGTTQSFVTQQAWYGGATYRFNKRLEVGGYYTEYYSDVPATSSSDGSQKDEALSLRFDAKPWWVIKLEGHFIRGTALLDDNADNPARNGDGWFMIAVKTTFSF
jgi:hypothetical protein